MGQVRNEILTEMAEKDEAAISISVTLEGEIRWRRYGNIGDRRSGSTSDIFLRDAEVDFEFKPTDYITGKLVLKSEYFGSDTTDGGAEADSAVVVDEATITFEQEDGFPLYAVIGKRTQPFGAFYERLVTDPPAKDAYEANQVGITVGYKNKAWWGLDASFTAYRQEELMDHFFGSTLFDNVNIVRASSVGLADSSDNIESFIGAVNITPLADLTLGGGISSEPGAGRRNQTAGFWGSYTWGPLTAEAEFYIALTREDYVQQVTTTDPATGEDDDDSGTPRPELQGEAGDLRALLPARSRRWSWACDTPTSGMTAWRAPRASGPSAIGSASGRAGSSTRRATSASGFRASTGTARSSAGARPRRRPRRISTSSSARCR